MANIDVYSLTLPNDNNTYWLKDKSLQDAKGAANGIAELDSTGKVPSSQLPSYVDDVIEVADYSHLPITGETGKIYVTLDDNKTYRWSGTGYTEISSSLALGETSSTAYRGDRGKTAYNHATETKLSTATSSGLYKVASTAQGHIASLTAVQKSDITALGIPGSDTKNTAGSTDTSSKIFLVGATSQGANPQTYSDDEVYATSGTLNSKKVDTKAIIALTGTGTAGSDKGSGVSPRYIPSLWTFNSGVTVANGEIYFIKIPVAGGTYGVWLSLNNGTNYYPVAVSSAKGRFTTQYAANTVIAVTYESAGVCTCFARTGGDSTSDVTGIFRVLNDYDANTTYSAISTSELTTGTATSSRVVRADYLKAGINSLIDTKIGSLDVTGGTNTAGKTVNAWSETDGKISLSFQNISITKSQVSDFDHSHDLSLAADSGTSSISLAANTKYKLTAGGSTYVFTTPTDTNNAVTQTATNTNTNYEVLFSATADNTTRTEGARKNSNLKFNPSTGDLKTTKINGVTLGDSPKFTDTTYTFTGGINKFSYSPSGTIISIDVPITPSIENNITGSGTSEYLTKFNGANTITNGPAIGSDITKYLRNDGTWQVPPDTKYNDATTSTHGLMSTTDKAKVDKINTTTTSASGNPISITGLKSNQLAVNPVITFEPIQAGSGDPSPSNVRAISGYDKIEVLSCGKNLFGGVYNESYSLFIPKGTTITVSIKQHENPYTVVNYYDKNGTRIDYVGLVVASATSENRLKRTFTLPDDAYSFKFDTAPCEDMQIEIGTYDSEYVSCNKTTDLSEQLPQTVYGGTLDARTGKLTVTKLGIDLSTITWTLNGSSGSYYWQGTTISNIKKPSNNQETPTWIMFEKFTPIRLGAVAGYSGSGAINVNGVVFVCVSANDSTTQPSGKMVYELAEPIEIQLTPHEISLLKDYAYVSTNGTNIAFGYHNGEIATLGDVSQLGETVNEIGNGLFKAIKITRSYGNVVSGTRYSYCITDDYPFINNDSIIGLSHKAAGGSQTYDYNGLVNWVDSNNKIYISYVCQFTQNNASMEIYILYK